MTATRIAPKVLSWASELDEATAEQAARTARLPFVLDPLALMPDAHLGIGATVGSVIATDGVVIPAAVGVDIGCGMIAARTDIGGAQLPDDLTPLLSAIERAVPAGMGRGHSEASDAWGLFASQHEVPAMVRDDQRLASKAAVQFGTLGSGNHFVEICLDETQAVWVLLHSGSRGVGNQIAVRHIETARGVLGERLADLEDRDLAHLAEGTPEFDAYIADMTWSQDYAAANRQVMVEATSRALIDFVGRGVVVETVNCHHNFTQHEVHDGRGAWVTRKGAIQAGAGQRGIIPGSMGTGSFIVRGKGSAASWESCSHGAGRRMSRGQARRELSTESLAEAMAGKTWLADKASELLDEHPDSYKPIARVMADQADLVEIEHSLTQILNYKGTSDARPRRKGGRSR